MPDITMCRPVKCAVRHTCYRFKAIPDPHWQSTTDFSKLPRDDGKCGYFLPVVVARKA